MIRETAKAFARQIPVINALIRQRHELLSKIAGLRAELSKRKTSDNVTQKTPTDRRNALTSHLNLEGLGLEIGPAYSPLLPKSEGYHVETVDYTDADHLRKKFRGTDQDVSSIEEVDYVSGGGSIFDAIGKPSRYDYIIASHVIEHLPDLLGFLKDCGRLLKPDGHLALAVPDKRFCFDIFQGLTTTGQVLQAHVSGARRPSPAVLFDYIANYGRRGDRIVWSHDDSTEPHLAHDLATAKSFFERAHSTDEYLDAHVWRFVPSSFRLIIQDLNELGEIPLREFSFVETGEVEFFAILSSQGHRCPLDRLTLAKQALNEQAEVRFP